MPVLDTLLSVACNFYNQAVAPRPASATQAAGSEELKVIEEYAQAHRSDISDHLPALFSEAAAVKPRLIVELGTRGGESTFALARAAALSDAHLISVDIEDCACRSDYGKWFFVKQDDVAFAAEFPRWCSSRSIEPRIDVLFIDTSHLYEHTREELRTWMPHLSPRGKMILHDTNMRKVYRRADGSLGVGWNNARGVIRALEEALGTQLDERHDFVKSVNGYRVRHFANCNGLTVIEHL